MFLLRKEIDKRVPKLRKITDQREYKDEMIAALKRHMHKCTMNSIKCLICKNIDTLVENKNLVAHKIEKLYQESKNIKEIKQNILKEYTRYNLDDDDDDD